MHPNLYLSPLAACLALTMASPVKAADAIPLQKTSLKILKTQFQIVLPGSKNVVAVSQANTLNVIKQHTDQKKVNHVRMQQQYMGFKVLGGYAIAHSEASAKSLVAGNDAAVRMNGVVYEGLKDELGTPADDFIKNGQTALKQLQDQHKGQALSEARVTPVVYIDEQNKAHWAYQVSVVVTPTDSIPQRPSAIVDAQTNKAYVQWNDMKTSAITTVKGLGFGGNEKSGEVAYGKDLPALEITRNETLAKCYMETDDVKVIDMQHRYSSDNLAMQFTCHGDRNGPADTFWTGYKADGYDRENGAYSPTNDAMYAGYVIKHMYHDWYGVEALTEYDGSPMQLVMRVHYGNGYENAYWDGSRMTFGDGEDMMYPLVSLGVGAHEISHGFTEQHSDLAYYAQSGGMNESFSDMAAMAADYYSIGTNNWMIGAEIMKEDSGYEALRFMDMPSRDDESIDTADEYYNGLDVHHSSGVYNRLFYLMSTKEGWNTRKAFDVMVKANMDYWTPYTSFDEGACGILNAAKDLDFDVESIKPSLDTVKLKYNACGK